MSSFKAVHKAGSFVLAGTLAFMLSGCFTSEPPKCSDEEATELVKSLYTEMIENLGSNPYAAIFSGNVPKSMTSLDSIRPVAYDESVKIRSCKAAATLENGAEVNIEYTIQLNEEDSNDYYVELSSDFLEGLMMQNIMQNLKK